LRAPKVTPRLLDLSLQVILTVMDALEKLLLCDRLAPGGPVIGRALVPYYRQILPVMNIFLTVRFLLLVVAAAVWRAISLSDARP
jgi:hypothetical protein